MSTERERFEAWAESDELPPDHGGAWRAWRAALSAQAEAHAMQMRKANAQAEHFEREWYLRGDELDALRDVLTRNGFVRCDIASCNCGSWHARYGYPQRFAEVKDALSDAGHPLCNDNGNLLANALAELIADRDALRAQAEALKKTHKDAAALISELWSNLQAR
jgi:hypothetical protein